MEKNKPDKILQDLKDYFRNTPKDKVKADWDATKEKCKGVKSPTVSEFIKNTELINKRMQNQELVRKYIRDEATKEDLDNAGIVLANPITITK